MDYSQVIGAIVAVSVSMAPAVFAIFKIRGLRVMVNGRISELIEAVRAAALAQGKLMGRDEVISRNKAEAEAKGADKAQGPPAVLAVPAVMDSEGRVKPSP